MLVVSMPLKGVLQSYIDSNAAREVKGKVERRGLCGDVFLVSEPTGAHVGNVKVTTSVRKSDITIEVSLEHLDSKTRYRLHGIITRAGRKVREVMSPIFTTENLHEHRMNFSEKWKPEDLWDIHAPTNQYEISVSLKDETEHILDEQYRAKFGFREFWIEGRHFYLNGSRIFLCAVPLDNAQVGAALATYEGARESLERLKAIGINFVYTHNYGCEPGTHLSFTEILSAADDVGMLVSLSQPHFSHYDWRSADAEKTNGYAKHAKFYTEVAQNHPSVVTYSMSHNATGYEQDMNPDMIDGLQEPRDQWSSRNAKLALRAEALVKELDPTRIVYHHASGNLGSMHCINFYPNFVPVQELSDWFEHWATQGVKPVFTCEFGAPFTWDWTMYRGWYNGQRNFGSAEVPWEFCLAEWNSQFLGDRAFQISKSEAANLRWEAKQFRAGKVWHRWDYPNPVGSTSFDERYTIFAKYLTDNWRSFRTWGVSGISPWEFEHFWKLRGGMQRRRVEFKVDWDNLQRPGFSSDFIDTTYERMDLAFSRSDWVPTEAARALLRNNQPLLAYIGGKPEHFTSKDHLFLPGELVEKQLIIINNSRQIAPCEIMWSFELPQPLKGGAKVTIKTGEQERLRLRLALPDNLSPGNYLLNANFRFANGETQTDSFVIQVVQQSKPLQISARIAVFDPIGETRKLLQDLRVTFQVVDASDKLANFDLLIVGKAALKVDGKAPDIKRVREGLKVLVFEQTADVLEKRFGFRVAEYGLREVFPRIPDHPLLAGIGAEHLQDWRGEATIVPSRLDYTLRPRYGPTVEWCDIPVAKLWRCGNRGNVASVLIEKPACGDFLPILDGGFGLQYSPLIEYREGKGMVLLCQVDVTGRTESEPVAEILCQNLLKYVSDWKPKATRPAMYAGSKAGEQHLKKSGFDVLPYDRTRLASEMVLLVGPGGGQELARDKTAIADWLASGGKIFAIGMDQSDADAVLPFHVQFRSAEHIAAYFEANGVSSIFCGIGPADVHDRDPQAIPLLVAGASRLGDGVLGTAGNVAFCSIVPWDFDPKKQLNLKRTFRRSSFLMTRLMSNLGVRSATPILERFAAPASKSEKRWLTGFYLDEPSEWDYPYRFFRW
ncbi:MAG TPA: glycoside hydrolase family 2 TIM barrel-domain containing protein [Verrucomicrobiae bacterium]